MNILYLFEGAFNLWRRRLKGVYAQARELGWHVEPINADDEGVSAKASLRFWRPDGVIVDGAALNRSGFSQSDFGEIPIVYCDADDEVVKDEHYGVRHDSRAAVKLALDELIALRRRSYGYVHYFTPQDWSDDRERLFLRRTGAAGLRAEVFDSCEAYRKADAKTFFRRLSRFLVDLPRPCGILAANDEMGVHVINAALSAGLRVPEDVAVTGIDDDELLCENVLPTLTSVAPDFELSGRLRAARPPPVDQNGDGVRPSRSEGPGVHTAERVLRRDRRGRGQDDGAQGAHGREPLSIRVRTFHSRRDT